MVVVIMVIRSDTFTCGSELPSNIGDGSGCSCQPISDGLSLFSLLWTTLLVSKLDTARRIPLDS